MSNNKQYATATLMYAQDYDELLPFSAVQAGLCVATFYQVVEPYVKNAQITQCPSEAQALKIVDLTGFPCQGTPPYTSYVVNFGVFPNGFFPGARTISLAEIQKPAETVMTYDGNAGINFVNQQNPLPLQLIQARHNLMFNANFVDGHAKAITGKDTGFQDPQWTVFGPGKNLKVYTIGQNGGFYAGMYECNGLPQ